MLEKLQWVKFSVLNLHDAFFDSLRVDYPGFNEWFQRKSAKSENALVLLVDGHIKAFLYLKEETESITTSNEVFPIKHRYKIGTLKLDESVSNMRLGEGVIAVALWNWQRSAVDEIYVTIFEKHAKLIGLLNKFGFIKKGIMKNGELLLMRSRLDINYSDPYQSFPFISPAIKKAGLIPICDYFHDRLFPYFETKYSTKNVQEITAGNGITKVYIGSPASTTHYAVGEPIFVYRIYSGPESKSKMSAITSFCTITKITVVKSKNKPIIPLEYYLEDAGNKTVFTEEELRKIYTTKPNVVMIEMVHNGFFDKNHNIPFFKLKNNGLFEGHPYKIDYTIDQMKQIMRLGGQDVSNIIID